jgi:ribulose-phosphate 3-epimerase
VARLDKVNALTFMTVNPGFSGQAMDMSTMPKLERISALLREKDSGADIEIDGGVEPENVHEVVKRGGNVLVAGAGVYGKSDPVKAIGALRERAELAAREK